jgi:hypothetical protein
MNEQGFFDSINEEEAQKIEFINRSFRLLRFYKKNHQH